MKPPLLLFCVSIVIGLSIEISDSLKKYADDENPITATTATIIGNILPIFSSEECSINFLYTESFTLKKVYKTNYG